MADDDRESLFLGPTPFIPPEAPRQSSDAVTISTIEIGRCHRASAGHFALEASASRRTHRAAQLVDVVGRYVSRRCGSAFRRRGGARTGDARTAGPDRCGQDRWQGLYDLSLCQRPAEAVLLSGHGGRRRRRHAPFNDPEDKDHPHHKGIWASVDEVNGIKFWAEKGKIASGSVELVKPSGNPAVLKTVNHWLGDDSKSVLVETTTISIYANRLMIFDITLTKGAAPVEFEDTKEGFFGVRVATSMREKVGGTIVNAAGERTTKVCWGKPSPWVDYTGPVGEKSYGVAIFDSPKNFRPSRYHVRDYGLFSVSPFGEGAYQNDASKKQHVHLDDQHPSLNLTYGIYIHSGDAAEGKVAEAYDEFAKLVK